MDTTPTTSSASPKKPNQRKKSYLLLAVGSVLLVTAFLIGISDNTPGIVAFLGGFLAVVLGIFFFFAKSGKRKPSHQLLYWTPRALCIVIAVVASLFALDVFGKGKGVWETTLALLIHLIPTCLILIVLAVSWRREWVGAVLFPALGVWHLIHFWGRFPLATYIFTDGLVFLLGVLFLLNWLLPRTTPGEQP
jgi:hypothetical protein